MPIATPTPLSALSVAERSSTPVTGNRTIARGAFLGIVAVYALVRLTNPTWWDLFDDVNLAIHEAGHIFFGFLGDIPGVLGGSLFQVIVPVVFAGYFFRTRQLFSGAMTLAWVGQSLVNVSIYIRDARAQELALLGGENSIHDWWYLLISWDLLESDIRIAGFVRFLGAVCFLASLALGAAVTFGDARNSSTPPAGT